MNITVIPVKYPEGVTEKEVSLLAALLRAGVSITTALSFMAAITAPNPERN